MPIIGVTFGAFDLLHPGHLMFLQNASRQCDILNVGLHVDPSIERKNKHKPIQTMLERFIQLDSLDFVERIFPYETERDIENYLATENLNKYFVGGDYEDHISTITGYKICIKRLIDITCIERLHGWSSSDLRFRVYNRQIEIDKQTLKDIIHQDERKTS